MTMSNKIRQRWVVKVGSQLVITGGTPLIQRWMQQLMHLKVAHGVEVIWVTSGAIASAAQEVTGHGAGPQRTLTEKQALSAIGQPSLMGRYNLSLQAVGLKGAQVLVTYGDIADPTRSTNLKNTLEKLLEWGVIPVLNENDAVATEEIKFGDNDSLSAKIAIAMRATRLVILTNVEGLYEQNPAIEPAANRVKKLARVTDDLLLKLKTASRSAVGTGGIYSKLVAAREASENGIETWLLKGDTDNVLLSAAESQDIGTAILPTEKPVSR